MGFLSKIRKGMKKQVAQMPRRRGGFLRGMPMMKPSIGDMRFRDEMPRSGGFGNLGEAIRRLNQQQGMRPQPIPRAEIDISALERLPMGDMPMTQDLPEVSPIEMMAGRTLQQDFPAERRMMMADGDVAEKETLIDFLTKDRRGRKPGNAFSLGKDIYDFVNQPEPSAQMSPEQELFSLQAQLKNLEEQLRLDRSYNDDQAVINTSAEMAAIQKRIQEIMEGRPQLAGGGDFPDLTGDGKVTQADILKGRGVYAEGDEVVSDDIINDYLEGIAFEMVDKKGNVRSKRNEPIIAYTDALTKMVGPEQAQSLISQAIERKKIENSQKYLDFITSAPESAKLAEEYKIIQKMRGYAEGDEVIMEGNEIDAMLGGMDSEEAGAMEDLEQMAPEMEMIDQLVTMVVQMIQQGASEEEVIMFLREQGLDDEDIGTVLQLVAEMAEAEAMPQDGIDAELAQLS